MKWVGVLPWTYRPYYEACVGTMHPDFRKHVLEIDNEGDKNIGIMKAHNMGIDFMKEQGADWLIVMSAAIRFGKKGGLDFAQILLDHPDYYVIHAATPNVIGGKQQTKPNGGKNGVFGWHLTAFNKDVLENIGRWDENFTPYGYDDIDLSIRIQKHYKGKPGWDTFPCDVHDTTMGHSINLGGVTSDDQWKIDYFKRKWGRYHGEWQVPTYDHPFDNPENSLAYWPQAANGSKWDD